MKRSDERYRATKHFALLTAHALKAARHKCQALGCQRCDGLSLQYIKPRPSMAGPSSADVVTNVRVVCPEHETPRGASEVASLKGLEPDGSSVCTEIKKGKKVHGPDHH